VWHGLALLALLFLAGCGGQLPETGEQPEAGAAQTSTAPIAQPALTNAPPAMQTPGPAETTQPEPSAAPQTEAVTPAPDCSPPAALTPAMTEGPYFSPGSPERASLLEPDVIGTPLVITGYVLSADCEPIAGALLDFWQADGQGEYDNAGYRLRGHQFTDQAGRYRLETVAPGEYPGRTPHIHVKVQAPDGPVLTTQMFLPDEPGNQSDSIFSPDLVMVMQAAAEAGLQATFDFVLGN
jgi:protocatechuate 3,4-dioxygenase beta subunit